LKSKNAEIVLFRQELDVLLVQMQEAAGGWKFHFESLWS
jgi:hypothetical protein